MSQDYVDDVYDSTFVVQTTMANVEKNFAALKSAFSGAAQPSNMVAGMWWYDTTANILKLRNEANTAWQSVWDFANNKPVITNLVLADFPAVLKSPAAGTEGFRKLGTGATDACAGNDARLSDARPPTDGSVSQSKLKTDIGGVSGTSSGVNTILPGGEYGFYPQVKMSSTASANWLASMHSCENIGLQPGFTSYRTNIYLNPNTGGLTVYAQQRYVTSSGEVHWIFILRAIKDYQVVSEEGNPYTIKAGTIISMYQAPDHPCFGNGGKPLLVQHPFGDYDETKHEIIVINPSHEEVEAMKRMGERGEDEPDKDLLEVIMEEYEIDENSKPAWPTVPVTVGLPKDYETKQMGEEIQPVKKVIPKPDGVITGSLRRKR